jgi:hypothetical protein
VTGAEAEGDQPIRLANEFADVVIERVSTRNGTRLRIFVPSTGAEILLCPLELEALTWQDHDFFTGLLADPFGHGDGA